MTNIKRTSTVTAADIKSVRETAGLTQVEAAELIGIKRTAYQSYERGTVAMSEAVFEYFKKQVAKLNKLKGK